MKVVIKIKAGKKLAQICRYLSVAELYMYFEGNVTYSCKSFIYFLPDFLSTNDNLISEYCFRGSWSKTKNYVVVQKCDYEFYKF